MVLVSHFSAAVQYYKFKAVFGRIAEECLIIKENRRSCILIVSGFAKTVAICTRTEIQFNA